MKETKSSHRFAIAITVAFLALIAACGNDANQSATPNETSAAASKTSLSPSSGTPVSADQSCGDTELTANLPPDEFYRKFQAGIGADTSGGLDEVALGVGGLRFIPETVPFGQRDFARYTCAEVVKLVASGASNGVLPTDSPVFASSTGYQSCNTLYSATSESAQEALRKMFNGNVDEVKSGLREAGRGLVSIPGQQQVFKNAAKYLCPSLQPQLDALGLG